jgi:hypothetical protein
MWYQLMLDTLADPNAPSRKQVAAGKSHVPASSSPKSTTTMAQFVRSLIHRMNTEIHPVDINGYPRRVCTRAPQAIWKMQTECNRCSFGTTLGPHFMRCDERPARL